MPRSCAHRSRIRPGERRHQGLRDHHSLPCGRDRSPNPFGRVRYGPSMALLPGLSPPLRLSALALSSIAHSALARTSPLPTLALEPIQQCSSWRNHYLRRSGRWCGMGPDRAGRKSRGSVPQPQYRSGLQSAIISLPPENSPSHARCRASGATPRWPERRRITRRAAWLYRTPAASCKARHLLYGVARLRPAPRRWSSIPTCPRRISPQSREVATVEGS